MTLRRDQLPQLAYSERGARARWAEEHDLALMEGLREDDPLALDELVARKTQPLLQVVQRILGDLEEARDVVQITLLRVWQRRREYDSRWQPNTWIFRIATNIAIDLLRSRRSRERSTPGRAPSPAPGGRAPGAPRPVAPRGRGGPRRSSTSSPSR